MVPCLKYGLTAPMGAMATMGAATRYAKSTPKPTTSGTRRWRWCARSNQTPASLVMPGPMCVGWAMSRASPATPAGQPLIPPASTRVSLILPTSIPANATGHSGSPPSAMSRFDQVGFITSTRTTRYVRPKIYARSTLRRWDGAPICWSICPSHQRDKSMRRIEPICWRFMRYASRFLPQTSSTRRNSAPARCMTITCSVRQKARFGCQNRRIRRRG